MHGLNGRQFVRLLNEACLFLNNNGIFKTPQIIIDNGPKNQHWPFAGSLYASVGVALSQFAEYKKGQKPNLWPCDYSFMRMSRKVAAKQKVAVFQIIGVRSGYQFGSLFKKFLQTEDDLEAFVNFLGLSIVKAKLEWKKGIKSIEPNTLSISCRCRSFWMQMDAVRRCVLCSLSYVPLFWLSTWKTWTGDEEAQFDLVENGENYAHS